MVSYKKMFQEQLSMCCQSVAMKKTYKGYQLIFL